MAGASTTPPEILRAAKAEPDGEWPLELDETPAVILTGKTPRMKLLTYQDRKAAAHGPYRAALLVRDPKRVDGCDVLV